MTNSTRGLHVILEDWSLGEYSSRRELEFNLLLRNCDVGQLLSPNDPGFCASLEDGIRPLVLRIGDRLQCVTYSSCEGHLAGQTITPAHVGMVFRSGQERTRAVGRLKPLLDRRCSVVAQRLIEGEIYDSDGPLPCLDIVFEGLGVDGPTYIRGARLSAERLVRRLADLPRDVNYLPTAHFLGTLRKDMRMQHRPYAWLHVRQLFEPADVGRMLESIRGLSPKRVVRRGFSLSSAGFSGQKSRLVRAFAGAVAFVVGRMAQVGRLHLVGLELHEMRAGDLVSIHTDQPSAREEMWRLVLYLDSVPQTAGGAHLVLDRLGNKYRVHRSIQPQAGNAVLFAMSDESFHAVTPLAEGATRRTIVATYRR